MSSRERNEVNSTSKGFRWLGHVLRVVARLPGTKIHDDPNATVEKAMMNARNLTFVIFRRFMARIQNIIASIKIFKSLEAYVLKRPAPGNLPPVFIIGAPRSGSTLLYQLLICHFAFSYITNLSSLFYTCPALVTKMTRRFATRYRAEELASKYGYVSGLWSPSEAGPLLRYWLDSGVQYFVSDEERREWVRQSIAHIESIMGGPFISKNLNNSMRLPELVEIFPDAIFINLKRKPAYIAQSILLTRRALSSNDSTWVGVRSPNFEELMKLSNPLEQVVCQIKSIEDHIQTVTEEKGIRNMIEVNYGDVCNDWRSELEDISRKCGQFGLDLQRIEHKKPLGFSLRKSEEQRLNDWEWEELKGIVERAYGSPGLISGGLPDG